MFFFFFSLFLGKNSSFSFIQVFSAFGFVHKIATFEKTAGFQVSESFKLHFFECVTGSLSVLTMFYAMQGSDSVH